MRAPVMLRMFGTADVGMFPTAQTPIRASRMLC